MIIAIIVTLIAVFGVLLFVNKPSTKKELSNDNLHPTDGANDGSIVGKPADKVGDRDHHVINDAVQLPDFNNAINQAVVVDNVTPEKLELKPPQSLKFAEVPAPTFPEKSKSVSSELPKLIFSDLKKGESAPTPDPIQAANDLDLQPANLIQDEVKIEAFNPISENKMEEQTDVNKVAQNTTFQYYNARLKSLEELKEIEEKQNSERNAQPVPNSVRDIAVDGAFKQDPFDADVDDNLIDDSLIDVTKGNYNLNIERLGQPKDVVPHWPHRYVYSYAELKTATEPQKEFYRTFKEAFVNGVYSDLQGNTNYAFILLFDLLDDYKRIKDTKILEIQLSALGIYYPVTRSYASKFLIEKFEEINDWYSVNRLRVKFGYVSAHNNEFNWQLGTRLKKDLNLSDADMQLLNRFNYYGNTFTEIPLCCKNLVKVFLAVKTKFNLFGSEVVQTGSDFLANVAKEISVKHYNNPTDSHNGYYQTSILNDIHFNIFKHCENYLRDYYGHKRNINADVYYSPDVKALYQTAVVERLKDIISPILNTLDTLDNKTEIELNRQNTTRWKITFESLKESGPLNPAEFVENVKKLADLNIKNPSVENIYFEASKFISKFDKQAALSLYVYYLDVDLASSTFDNKQLTKTIQKSLFKTNEQLHDFERIISQLISDRDLSTALTSVSDLYTKKRKKIKLDIESISAVQQQHSETVKVLNEYLQDEFEDESTLISSKQINAEEIEIKIVAKSDTNVAQTYVDIIHGNDTHEAILQLFAKNNFTLLQDDVQDFAKSRGMFKNQLIDSINENCFDILDDVLIEEEETFYIINPPYYQRLLINA